PALTCKYLLMMYKNTATIFTLLLATQFLWPGGAILAQPEVDSVHFTTGFQVGEVTDSSAVLLVRLHTQAKPVPVRHERKAAPMRYPINFFC
ncbi:MAG: hypothetical protein AAGF89_05675, partial [Bacteroidota bacterium]